jgi:hypothetical protein
MPVREPNVRYFWRVSQQDRTGRDVLEFWGNLHVKTRPRNIKEAVCRMLTEVKSKRSSRQNIAVTYCKVRGKQDSHGLERRNIHRD